MRRLLQVPSLRALRHAAYTRILLGALISNVGTWMETVGVGIYVTQTTGKAAWTGAVSALMWLPAAVFAPLGGALGDRLDRRRYLSAVNLAQTALAASLALLAATGHLTVERVAFVVFLGGCATALSGPAFSALLSDLVPTEDLLSAVSLSSAQWNLGRFLGPAIAAAVIASGGLGWAFAINTVSFAAVLFALSTLAPSPPRATGTPPALWATIREGLTVSLEDDLIRPVLGLMLGVAFLVAPFIGLVPAYAITVLGKGATATSLMVMCQGAGAVVGALALGSLSDRFGRRRVLEVSSLSIGIVAAAYWLAPTVGTAAALLAVLGANYLAILTSASTSIQARVPSHLRGRVAAIYSLVVNGAYALGLMAMGALGDRVGLRSVMVGSALLFTAGLAAMRALRPTLFAELDTSMHPVDPLAAPVEVA